MCNSMSSASDREVYLAVPQPTVTFNVPTHLTDTCSGTYLSASDTCSARPTDNNTCTVTPGTNPAAAAAADGDTDDEVDDDDDDVESSATSTTVRLTNSSISCVHSSYKK